MFDFKKAFGTLGHSTLLRIMRKLNFSDATVRWFHSYLSERFQAIIDLQGCASEPAKLTSGIPQGSIPGPVAFLMLINSIVTCLKHCSESCILFADDFKIYLQCKRSDLSSCIGKLNEDINSVANWAVANDLQLNMSKTTAIIFASPQNLLRLDVSSLPPIFLNGTQIPLVKTIKNLGVTFCEDLTWNSHVSSISKRVHGVLKRHRAHFLSWKVKKLLLNALVLPLFDYACLVYCDLSGYLAVKLQRLQNFAEIYFSAKTGRLTFSLLYQVKLANDRLPAQLLHGSTDL